MGGGNSPVHLVIGGARHVGRLEVSDFHKPLDNLKPLIKLGSEDLPWAVPSILCVIDIESTLF